VSITLDIQRRVGLKVEAVTARVLDPELVAYGTLEEDPSRAFVLRAPVAGQIRRLPSREVPGVGDVLADGEVVGMIEPRFAAMERVDLAARLASARAEAVAARAALGAARAALERTRTLNAEDRIASDRAVQEAEVRVRSDEARLAALSETAAMLEVALKGGVGPASARPLIVEQGGEVIEASGRAGEVVEAGQPILRLNRLDRLVARIVLPIEPSPPGPILRARIGPFGREDRLLAAERIALAAPADQGGRGPAVLFRVRRGGDALLRPGTPVTAYLAVPGAAHHGVVVPRAAIVRAGGKAWVYEQVDDDDFVRREITLDRPTDAGWFVSGRLESGAKVVVAGAQILLSEEFKSQIPIADDD
jgi:hypothetical protein